MHHPTTNSTFLEEDKLHLTELARRLNVHVNSIHRWAVSGTRGHRLRVERIGGRTFCHRADFDAFHRAINSPKKAG